MSTALSLSASIPHATLETSIPQRHPTAIDKEALVRDVALRSLIELGVSLAIGAVAFFFTPTLLQGGLLFLAIAVQTVCNLALRYVEAIASHEPDSKHNRWTLAACRYLSVTTFAYLTAVNAQSLIHESGHALAAKSMFQNANPQITITPCLGGRTRFHTAHLTRWGEKLGKSNAMLLITLMGPAATLLVSGIAMAIGLIVQDRLPELGSYLVGVGRGDFYAHSFHALTALSSSPPSSAQDFVRLKAFGIHPLVSAVVILAIPVLIAQINRPSSETALRTAE